MKPEEIQIPRKITNQLLHYSQLSPEAEICGLIGSRKGHPVSCYPVNNVSDQPRQRFLLDGHQQIEAMANMRDRNEELFAIYHSHPNSPATPSAIDLEMAAYPEALYLIISLNTKGVLELRGFRISEESLQEVILILSET